MGERLDRVLALLERLVVAAERLAERDVRPPKAPPPQLPPKRGRVLDDEQIRHRAAARIARAGVVTKR